MGRARGHSPQAAATTATPAFGRFDAVVGARRGSVSAQAARDDDEKQVREDSLQALISAVESAALRDFATDTVASSFVVPRLVEAYRVGAHQPGAPGYEELRQDLEQECEELTRRREMMRVIAHGDPAHWPGLTEPAVSALGALLHARAQDGSTLLPTDETLNYLFPSPARRHSPEHYQRLTPVLDGLAAILRQVPRKRDPFACERMAAVLRCAPAESFAGPLQPLVQAFAQRITEDKPTKRERAIFYALFNDRELSDEIDRLPENERDGLRPIAEALYPSSDESGAI